MEDPLPKLLDALQPVFNLAIMRNEQYIYHPVQQLKETLDAYQLCKKMPVESTKQPLATILTQLMLAVQECLPYIEKSRVHFETLRDAIDTLAKAHKVESIHWDNFLSRCNLAPQLKFNTLNHSLNHDDLLVWITEKSGKSSAELHPADLTQSLMDHRNGDGFTQKLIAHLNSDPDFLFNLIMQSEKNFIKIAHSRLVLYLTDPQLAKAILKHIPVLIHKEAEPYKQVELLILKLNQILSNGRSVSTLLRNTEAKLILDNSPFFQIYQSEEYQYRENNILHPHHSPEESNMSL